MLNAIIFRPTSNINRKLVLTLKCYFISTIHIHSAKNIELTRIYTKSCTLHTCSIASFSAIYVILPCIYIMQTFTFYLWNLLLHAYSLHTGSIASFIAIVLLPCIYIMQTFPGSFVYFNASSRLLSFAAASHIWYTEFSHFILSSYPSSNLVLSNPTHWSAKFKEDIILSGGFLQYPFGGVHTATSNYIQG